jgi:iron(III) transport system ATP-binding protein
MAEVNLSGITKSFGTSRVIDGLDLTVRTGELVALLGPSGCGKSTTLRIIAGLVTPDEGEVRVDGKILSSPKTLVPASQRGMSMIFQSYALWPHKTVFENVAFGLWVRNCSKADISARVERILKFVKMEAYAARYPAELSGGQQQRVALARALVIEPSILLLDEPLSNLDATLREELRYEIRRFHNQLRISTIYVTHDQVEAMVTADRIVVLQNGRIAQVGTPEDIYERPTNRFVAEFMGRTTALTGVVLDEGLIGVDAIRLKGNPAQNSGLKKGQKVTVSIVPHAVNVLPAERPIDDNDANTFSGKISSHFYIGSAREYEISIEGISSPLKASTAPWINYPIGAPVRVSILPQHCWIMG